MQPDGGGEVYVEFVVQGHFVKVTAIDSQTGVEASVVGPASASRASLSDVAVRKLRYVLQKKTDGGH